MFSMKINRMHGLGSALGLAFILLALAQGAICANQDPEPAPKPALVFPGVGSPLFMLKLDGDLGLNNVTACGNFTQRFSLGLEDVLGRPVFGPHVVVECEAGVEEGDTYLMAAAGLSPGEQEELLQKADGRLGDAFAAALATTGAPLCNATIAAAFGGMVIDGSGALVSGNVTFTYGCFANTTDTDAVRFVNVTALCNLCSLDDAIDIIEESSEDPSFTDDLPARLEMALILPDLGPSYCKKWDEASQKIVDLALASESKQANVDTTCESSLVDPANLSPAATAVLSASNTTQALRAYGVSYTMPDYYLGYMQQQAEDVNATYPLLGLIIANLPKPAVCGASLFLGFQSAGGKHGNKGMLVACSSEYMEHTQPFAMEGYDSVFVVGLPSLCSCEPPPVYVRVQLQGALSAIPTPEDALWSSPAYEVVDRVLEDGWDYDYELFTMEESMVASARAGAIQNRVTLDFAVTVADAIAVAQALAENEEDRQLLASSLAEPLICGSFITVSLHNGRTAPAEGGPEGVMVLACDASVPGLPANATVFDAPSLCSCTERTGLSQRTNASLYIYPGYMWTTPNLTQSFCETKMINIVASWVMLAPLSLGEEAASYLQFPNISCAALSPEDVGYVVVLDLPPMAPEADLLRLSLTEGSTSSRVLGRAIHDALGQTQPDTYIAFNTSLPGRKTPFLACSPSFFESLESDIPVAEPGLCVLPQDMPLEPEFTDGVPPSPDVEDSEDAPGSQPDRKTGAGKGRSKDHRKLLA